MLGDSFHFTKEEISKIKVPSAKQLVYKDIKEKGLILIVSYGGSKTYYFATTIQKEYHRIKVGRFPDVSVTDARRAVVELKNKIAKGINPVKKELASDIEQGAGPQEMTFKQLVDKYFDEHGKYSNKAWKLDVAQIEKKASHLYDRKISTIQRDDIQKILSTCIKIGNTNLEKPGKVAFNRCLACYRTIFNKAIEWDLLNKNPAIGIKKHKETPRDRYLTVEEVPRFFQALAEEKNQKVKDFILIALYTGVRKSNVLSMKWDDISLQNKTWYIPDTKNGDPQLVALDDKAIEVLKTRKIDAHPIWVFPSDGSKSGHLQEPKKVWHKVIKKAGLQNFRIHDLRRTFGSWMAMSGASSYIIGKALNHKSPQSTAIYARLDVNTVRDSITKSRTLMDKVLTNSCNIGDR